MTCKKLLITKGKRELNLKESLYSCKHDLILKFKGADT